MLLFGLLCSPSRDPGCIPRCCVLLCTFGDVVCRGAVYVPGYCVSGHAIRVVCPVSRDAAPGTLQAVFLVGRTRFDRLAFEGFARLEVVGHSDREAAVVPLLFDVDHAHEPVAAGADVLRALDQVAHRERGGELVAETLLDSGVQEMDSLYFHSLNSQNFKVRDKKTVPALPHSPKRTQRTQKIRKKPKTASCGQR